MGNCWIRISQNTQLWMLDHYNCLTMPILHILYAIDVIVYTITTPKVFLKRRSDLFGPNYAALGRIIVGEYAKCTELINSPQKRSYYLGRAKLIKSRLPNNFPLFLSDEGAGGGTLHATMHLYMWETLIPQAHQRIISDVDGAFQKYIQNGYAAWAALPKADTSGRRKAIQTMVIRYVFHAIFGIAMDDPQVEDFYMLFFGKSPMVDYVAGALKPWARPLMCCLSKRNKPIRSFTDIILDSPALENFVDKSETSGNLTKTNYAEILLAIVGIAGCIGTSQLCLQVLSAIPTDYDIDLDDKMKVTLAVLEAARMNAPVNNVNIKLQNKLTLTIKGKMYTFERHTPVAASIGLSSVDPDKFDNPHGFHPDRADLIASTINFNHVGYSEVGVGTRQCVGRNIAMKLASGLLIESRNPSAVVVDSFVDEAKGTYGAISS